MDSGSEQRGTPAVASDTLKDVQSSVVSPGETSEKWRQRAQAEKQRDVELSNMMEGKKADGTPDEELQQLSPVERKQRVVEERAKDLISAAVTKTGDPEVAKKPVEEVVKAAYIARGDTEEEAERKAKEYLKKTKLEIAEDVIEDLFNQIDFETFLMALLGQAVGNGRYGSRDGRSVEGNPEEDMLSMFQKASVEQQVKILAAGFKAANRKDESQKALATMLSGTGDCQELQQILEKLQRDPDGATKFMWGVAMASGAQQLAGSYYQKQGEAMIAIAKMNEVLKARKRASGEVAKAA